MNDHVAELQAALAERDRLIVDLQTRLARHEPPPPIARLDGIFVMPTRAQAHKLLDIVTAKYPVLRGRHPDELFTEFLAAFEFVSTLRRTDTIDAVHSNAYWCDAGAERRKRFSLFGFGAACVAAGDVDHVAFDRWPHELGWGVTLFEREGSRPASNAWLLVLDGRVRAALPLKPYREERGRPIELAPHAVVRY
jgi:hypothetical protein